MKIAASYYTGKRLTIISQRSFDEVVTRLDSLIAHPDMSQFFTTLRDAESGEALIQAVQDAVGQADLIEFMRFNLGAVLKKRFGPQCGRSLRILVGNPITMSSMTTHVPDAGLYAPVAILVDERPDGVHLCYDAMESHLAIYGSELASQVARELDKRVCETLERAAQ